MPSDCGSTPSATEDPSGGQGPSVSWFYQLPKDYVRPGTTSAGGTSGSAFMMTGNMETTKTESSLQKIWIVASGSRGDIQPYVAVGAALVDRGYHVSFLTYQKYIGLAEAFGMKGVALAGEDDDYESSILKVDNILRGMTEGNALKAFTGIAEMNQQNAPTFCQAFLAEIQNHGIPDLCLAMPFSQYLAWCLWVKHQVPFVQFTTYALSYNPDHMLLGLPKLPFQLTKYILHNIFVGGAYDGYRSYDDYLQAGVLNIFTKSKYIAYYKDPKLPMITLCSPLFAPVLYGANISSMWRFVGSTVLQKKQQQQQQDNHYFGSPKALSEMEAFLKATTSPNNATTEHQETPVVYLGWGSMICKSADHMVELCIRAVHRAQVRAIVLGGAAGLSLDKLLIAKKPTMTADILEYAKANILFVDYAPHEWLFPQVSATVHHGGAGTTTAALRGGVPTIITPVFGDQYDFSHVVNELGVGIGFAKQLHKITWQELGDALAKVTSNPEMAQRAAQLGIQLRSEDGANRAVDEIKAYWDNYCAKGQFQKHVSCQAEEKSTVNSPRSRVQSSMPKILVAASLVAGTVFVVAAWNKRRK